MRDEEVCDGWQLNLATGGFDEGFVAMTAKRVVVEEGLTWRLELARRWRRQQASWLYLRKTMNRTSTSSDNGHQSIDTMLWRYAQVPAGIVDG